MGKIETDMGSNFESTNVIELERIGDFINTLHDVENIRPIVPNINFSDERPIAFAKKRFIAFEYDGKPTLFIDPNMQTYFDDTTPLSFTPLISRGGKHSAHGVFFGSINIGEKQTKVAVKPHLANAFTTGLDDYFKTYAVGDLGIYTVTPAGMLLSSKEQERAYSMTLLEEGLTTLDSVDWSNYYPNIEQNPGMNELWRAVSGQAAMLHSDGNKAHGDMAARNIATGTENTVFFLDWEYAIIGKHAPRDAEGRYANSYADLSVLLESMCLPPHANIGGKAGIGIFYGKQGDWWEGFCAIFYDEYVHMRTELSTQGGHHRQMECEVAQELHELGRSLRQNMEMMKLICDSIPAVTCK